MNHQSNLKVIIENVSDGIITIDPQGTMVFANAGIEYIFGYQSTEIAGKKLSILLSESNSDKLSEIIDVQKSIGIRQEFLGKKKNGATFPFVLIINEVKFKDEISYIGIIHDITEEKNEEERLLQQTLELEKSTQVLRDFAYYSSHDLQEPLRKIQAFGDRLRAKEFDKLSEEGKDYLDRMLKATVRMKSLLDGLLSFSRTTTMTAAYELIDLNKILEEVLSDLEINIEKNQAKINHLPLPCIEADSTQIRQIFQNLISNAIKFRKENENPDINIYHKDLRELSSLPIKDQYIELYFKDNGIGFDEKYLDKIFSIFQKLEGNKYEGSGVGLAICQKIVMRHGGIITAKSEPGKGSLFIVKLPIKQPKNR